MQCGDKRRVGLFLASTQTQKHQGRRKPLGEALFVRECRKALRNLLGSSDLSWPRKELYRELVVGSASDALSERHGWTAEEIRSPWNWAPGSSFLNNSEFSLTWRLVRNALPLRGLNYKAGLADMPDCPRCGSGLEETPNTYARYTGKLDSCFDLIRSVDLSSLLCDMNWRVSCCVSALQSVVAGSISIGGDYGIHCWRDRIRSKQLSNVPVYRE